MFVSRTIRTSTSSSALSSGVKRSSVGGAKQHFHGIAKHTTRENLSEVRNLKHLQQKTIQKATRRRRFASVAEEAVEEPSFNTLKIVALGQAIPFIGFGFMDNSILIVAGDAIDT